MSSLNVDVSEIHQGSEVYEGKEKKIFTVDNRDDLIIIHYKDDATSLGGEKKGQIEEKGILNNRIASGLMELLEKSGIPTHFVQRLNDRDMLCKKVSIIPLRIKVRNFIAGTMAKRLGLDEGKELSTTVFEISYKDDKLGDPLINDYHAVALGVTTFEEIEDIKKITFRSSSLNAATRCYE